MNQSPVFREDKVAYTDANPLLYAEDDVFGYMRAPGGKGKETDEKRKKWAGSGLSDQDTEGTGDKLKFAALTRSSPFKMRNRPDFHRSPEITRHRLRFWNNVAV